MSSTKPPTSKSIGDRAETAARVYLELNGLQFIAQNYRCKMGEIDLIMREQNCWVFVEVKFRQQSDHGRAAEFYNAAKQRKLLNAVRLFLLDNQLNEHHTPIRIDVVAIDDDELEWIKNVTG
ncbi:YraN family protein [Alteromonas oceanisediminis]|uniref:YraN family protein n=1 Tax=Alteromonas oceanisediminis TaxID=2836180 RepID=UPI0020239A9F|nr:YraN family protein [Alteromonas oceanisediminis]